MRDGDRQVPIRGEDILEDHIDDLRVDIKSGEAISAIEIFEQVRPDQSEVDQGDDVRPHQVDRVPVPGHDLDRRGVVFPQPPPQPGGAEADEPFLGDQQGPPPLAQPPADQTREEVQDLIGVAGEMGTHPEPARDVEPACPGVAEPVARERAGQVAAQAEPEELGQGRPAEDGNVAADGRGRGEAQIAVGVPLA